MIVVDNLHKYYGERKAAGPLSFTIEKGEVVGLLGLNGAGKTTALRILACDLLPSVGSVRVDGIDVVDQPQEVRRRIGYLPDSPPLYGEMSVREFLVFAARLRGVPKADAATRAHEVEKVTSLVDVASDPIFSLSHGYKQRVGIAQALVHQPKILLLDEPILGLDPVQIVEMRHLLRSLRGDYTIVLSSHNLKEISETCDRLLVIRDGTIIASGTEAELSKDLLRGSKVCCTVRGDLSRAEKVVRSIEGVESVTSSRVEDEGDNGHALRIDADRDIRAKLVRSLVAADIDVVWLGQGAGELESVFLQLAGERDPEAVGQSSLDTSEKGSSEQRSSSEEGKEEV
ncbi:MAG: ABC transporter ATP-binding protein [Polyangiaceae bacterium]|nr:ABC transporter ATP-binding protein [Polyangiaceae bacterium]